MNIATSVPSLFQFDVAKDVLQRATVFLLFLLLSLLVGRYTPEIVKLIIRRFSPEQVAEIYDHLVEPIKPAFKVAGTFILISWSLAWIQAYPAVYNFVKPFVDLAVVLSLAWLASRLFRQFVRTYGIDLVRKVGREVDELLLVVETLANVLIGFVAIFAFAQSQQFNLIGLMASLGLGGLAIAFAAQKTLEQLLSTVVLYLDRPFEPGDYIRLPSGLFGRVESIGLRSTKIRTAAKSTLFIVPNSTLANLEIENITRGKKIMVLLYLDFLNNLQDREQALVQQVIIDSTNSVFGIDPGSTNITFIQQAPPQATQARVTFFILGSSENSLQLRKRLLEVANTKISQQLRNFGIEFVLQEPTIYIESPITI